MFSNRKWCVSSAALLLVMVVGCSSSDDVSAPGPSSSVTSSGQPSAALAGKWAFARQLANTTDSSYYLEIKATGEVAARGSLRAYLLEPYTDGCVGKVGEPDQAGRAELLISCHGLNRYFPTGPTPRDYKAWAEIQNDNEMNDSICESLEMNPDRGVLILSYPDRTDLLCRRDG
ncbi:hypothetical protein [Actinokineospora sp.]|uniref:hypothetical protein n=1 Tax=Actinokineospora sp. TaxID=1872133 RepID=UPI0040384B5A